MSAYFLHQKDEKEEGRGGEVKVKGKEKEKEEDEEKGRRKIRTEENPNKDDNGMIKHLLMFYSSEKNYFCCKEKLNIAD